MYGPVCEFRSSLTGFPAACSTSSRLLTLIHLSLPPRVDDSLKSYDDRQRSENVASVEALVHLRLRYATYRGDAASKKSPPGRSRGTEEINPSRSRRHC